MSYSDTYVEIEEKCKICGSSFRIQGLENSFSFTAAMKQLERWRDHHRKRCDGSPPKEDESQVICEDEQETIEFRSVQQLKEK